MHVSKYLFKKNCQEYHELKRTNKNPMAQELIKVGQTELFEEDPKKKGSKSGSIGWIEGSSGF